MEASPAPDYRTLWYEVVEDRSLRQGDIFRDLVAYWVPEPTGDSTEVSVGSIAGDFIIVSASCDVEQPGYEYVILNRIYPADENSVRQKGDELLKAVEVMRRGWSPSKFLLAPSDAMNPALPLSFVTSKTHTLLPIKYLQSKCVGPRLRLRSPLREAFGGWVAGCFGRVGIETYAQIPVVSKSLFPGHVLKYADE